MPTVLVGDFNADVSRSSETQLLSAVAEQFSLVCYRQQHAYDGGREMECRVFVRKKLL